MTGLLWMMNPWDLQPLIEDELAPASACIPMHPWKQLTQIQSGLPNPIRRNLKWKRTEKANPLKLCWQNTLNTDTLSLRSLSTTAPVQQNKKVSLPATRNASVHYDSLTSADCQWDTLLVRLTFVTT